MGTAHVFWGTVSPYALPADSAGHTLAALVAAQFTGFLLGVLSAPRLSARIGVGRHIAIALALFAVALSAPLWGLSPPILLAASVLLGAAAGSLETQIGALALEPTRGPRALTVLEACFGFAALLFPVLVFLLSPAISWRAPVAAAAIAMALLSVTWSYIHKVSLVRPVGERRPGPTSRRVPTAAACLLLAFAMVYAGFETNFANFLPRIVGSDGEVGASVLAVSGFWFGITSGRLITVTVVHAVVGRKALAGLAVGLTGVLVGLAQFGDGLLAALPWVVAAGVFASAMFPVAWRNEIDATVGTQLVSYRPTRCASRIGCPILVQIADFDRAAPPHAAAKAAFKARAEVRHYPCDHFGVYHGQECHELVIGHQISFLSRHLSIEAVSHTEALHG
ncbi:sugar MFS transporter [Mycobacteroides abscessus]|uniref:MFS transporter n=1 Tax=Mycobacteroides abscessus TaxID=36809 RepID=UPI0034E87BB9